MNLLHHLAPNKIHSWQEIADSHGKAADISITMCAFGAPYKKPTRLAVWMEDDAASPICHRLFSGKKCKAPPRKRKMPALCQFTGAQHNVLSGLSQSGKFKTMVAQPYPPMLAETLAQLFIQ